MFPETTPFEQILRGRLRWMVRLRWLVAAGILATVFMADRLAEVRYAKPPLYAVCLFILAYNLALEFRLSKMELLPRRRTLYIHANVQIGLDLFALLILVAFSGGARNLFVFYAIFHVAISSILLPLRNTIVLAVAICVAFTGLFWLDHFGLIPKRFDLVGFIPEEVDKDKTYVFGLSYLFVTMVAVTAYMAANIGNNLRDAQSRLMAVTREIEQRRSSSEARREEMARLEQAKSRFLSAAAGRFREPLENISDISGAFVEEGREFSTMEISENIKDLGDNSRVLLELVSDMIEAARLTDLEKGLPREEVNLAQVARAVAAEMEDLAKTRGVELNVEIAAETPPIRGDAKGWPGALANLIENAVNYSPPNSVVDFRLDRDWQGETITCEVKDKGIGIEPDDIRRIFDEFYRSENARLVIGGTGMGLAIVKKVVELHGGTIEVKSEPGRGTTFRFSVPVQRPANGQ